MCAATATASAVSAPLERRRHLGMAAPARHTRGRTRRAACRSAISPTIWYRIHGIRRGWIAWPTWCTPQSIELRLTRARHAETPAALGSKALEEVEVVGAFRRLSHQFVDSKRVLADQDAPTIRLDAVEDDGRCLRGGGWSVVDEASRPLYHHCLDVRVGHGGNVHACRRSALAGLRDLCGAQRVRLAAAMDLAGIGDNRGADMTGHDDRTFDVRRMHLQIGDQRLREALHRELRRAIRGVRDARSNRRPEAVDAAGVDDVRPVCLLQHRQKAAGAKIDAAPADVEGPFPRLAAVGEHAAPATDAGIVEQQMDLVRCLLFRDLVA